MDSDIVRYGHCFKCVYQKQWHLVQASSKLECKSLNVKKENYCSFTHVKVQNFKPHPESCKTSIGVPEWHLVLGNIK